LKKVWVANINYEDSKARSPFDREAVKSNDYPLTRPLYQYFVNQPTGKLLELIQFELSDAQQKNLELHGYYPITPIHQSINDKSLGDCLK
jgi:ABC-type phosphate transport system substrate-binding protein